MVFNLPRNYFGKLHIKFLKGERTRLNLLQGGGDAEQAQKAFYGHILKASARKVLPIYRTAWADPKKWQEILKTDLPLLKKYKCEVSSVLYGETSFLENLEKKLQRREQLTEQDARSLWSIAQGTGVWDLIGLKPSDLTPGQRIILANSSHILTGASFRYWRSCNSLYHLTSAMGYLFDTNKNDLREGIFDEFTDKMKKHAKTKKMHNPEGYVKGMQSALLGLRDIFRRINDIRRPIGR